MASRRLLPKSDIENVHKLTTLPGKQVGVLPNKGLTRRPALTDLSTNREAQRLPAQKPTNLIKRDKPITSFRDIKPIIKPVVRTKPEQRVIAKQEQKVAVKPDRNGTFKQEQKIVMKQERYVTVKNKNNTEQNGTIKEEQKVAVKSDEKIAENFVSVKEGEVVEEQNAYSVQYFGLHEDNETDPLLVPTYINDIISYLRKLEKEYIVSEYFLTKHATIPRMRKVLINWLVEVHLNFRSVQETLYLSVSIVDRYLEKNKKICRDNLQLVGITAVFIASKYEETYGPEMSDLVYVCDDTFSNTKILQMEQSIIKTLDFKFGNPCSLHFLRRYSKVCKVNEDHHILAKYLLELALVEHKFSSVAPSLLASAAICMAVQLLPVHNSKRITSLIEYISEYRRKDIAPIIKSLAINVIKMNESKYRAVQNKYATKSNNSISSRTELKHGLIEELAGII